MSLYELDQAIMRVRQSTTASPQELWDRGRLLCHEARVRKGLTATPMPVRTVVPDGPVEDAPRPSAAEAEHDRQSADLHRGPWSDREPGEVA